MMYKYVFPYRSIDFLSTNRIDLSTYNDALWAGMTLDFSRSSFITPYGMIFLYALVSHLREKYPDSPVRVIFPVGNDLFGYSCRMHLPQMLKEIGDVTISPEPYTVRERDRRASLQELKLADLPHNDAADEEADYLSQIIRRQTNFQVDTLEIIDTGLSELLSNVVTHSGKNQAILVAQTYQNDIRIAIGDSGVGIPFRLRPYQGQLKDDKTLISESLLPMVSSLGGGMGLTELKASITRDKLWRHGVLMIRSNAGWIWTGGEETIERDTAYIVPGTYVNILLKR